MKNEEDKELLARVRLASTPGITPRTAARFLRHFGSARAVLAAGRAGWLAAKCVGEARAECLQAAPDDDGARREMERLRAARGCVLAPGDEAWPPGMAELPDPPLVLFTRGELQEQDLRGVAIVGARRASSYGLAAARRIGGELASLGITVVSGLARGVDAAAHRGALAAGGRTVAVLGSGLARLYPPEHVQLAREIVSGHGAVLTEFPLEVPPLPHHFPRRNRILAALAAAVVVVEAGERSGSLITADHALDLGREVLAVPGRVDAPNSRGTHKLLRQGAALCEGVNDVLAALEIEVPDARAAAAADPGRTPAESQLLTALSGEEFHADELLARTGLPASEGLGALSALELRGVIELLDDGRYGRC